MVRSCVPAGAKSLRPAGVAAKDALRLCRRSCTSTVVRIHIFDIYMELSR